MEQWQLAIEKVLYDYKNEDYFVVMTRYGNIIEAGLTREEEKQRIENDLDDIIYSKPVAFVKKIQRRVKK